jgi:two-component system, LuxR family, response regulator FixJ
LVRDGLQDAGDERHQPSRLRNSGIDVSIILITGYPDEHILANAMAAGIRRLLLKPHLEDSLASHIRGVILDSHPR